MKAPETTGFFDSTTDRRIFRAGMTYLWGGTQFTYLLEYFHKDLVRDDPSVIRDMRWNVWRAKGTFEVAF